MPHDDYERIWWWIFVGTKGGITRAKIMKILLEMPLNNNQIAERLGLNYKTVEHHINILLENKLIELPMGRRYGASYYPSQLVIAKRDIIEKILKQALKDE
jgi:DNA-binding transcriptional ArsR family regulator